MKRKVVKLRANEKRENNEEATHDAVAQLAAAFSYAVGGRVEEAGEMLVAAAQSGNLDEVMEEVTASYLDTYEDLDAFTSIQASEEDMDDDLDDDLEDDDDVVDTIVDQVEVPDSVGRMAARARF